MLTRYRTIDATRQNRKQYSSQLNTKPQLFALFTTKLKMKYKSSERTPRNNIPDSSGQHADAANVTVLLLPYITHKINQNG